ncbi:hypothetical protein SBA4_6870005 [Candidatus Sulfopaludibacter sp. SbA4]|nr:hypothetical protein SBA4_6870005 [Candidatus Sulfopaludibacter sp. SbA4]
MDSRLRADRGPGAESREPSICLAALTIAAERGKADIAKHARHGTGSVRNRAAVPRDAYCVIYAVQLAEEIWVVHAFQKEKSEGDVEMKGEKLDVVRGSGNVFRDLGHKNADAEQFKAILAAEIIKALDRDGLSVRAAHGRTGIAAADFSRIRNADLGRFTVESPDVDHQPAGVARGGEGPGAARWRVAGENARRAYCTMTSFSNARYPQATRVDGGRFGSMVTNLSLTTPSP